MRTRPFRHLCPEADLRDAMSDDEFWAHVAQNLAGPLARGWVDEFDDPDVDVAVDRDICGTCGEVGACAYDSEGRALIHARDDEDEDAR